MEEAADGEDADLAAAIALSLAMAAGDAEAEHGAAADAEDAEAVARFLAFTGTSDAAAARAALAGAAGDVQVAVARFFGDAISAADEPELTLSDRFNRAQRMLQTGDARGALGEWLECLALARAQGHRQGEGAVLGNPGIAYESLGEYRKAIGYHRRPLPVPSYQRAYHQSESHNRS